MRGFFMAQTQTQMTEMQLKSILRNNVETAIGGLGGQITDIRGDAMDYYLGEPLGNEVEGSSQVISTDVADTIDSVLPDLVQPFTAGPDVVKYRPKDEEHEEEAELASEYANVIWNKDNDGFNIFTDWFKDAVLQINGIVKIWWEDKPAARTETFTGLTDDEVLDKVGPDNVEVMNHTEYADPDVLTGAQDLQLDQYTTEQLKAYGVPILHDVKIKVFDDPQVMIENVPPEEFLISPRAKTIKDAPFVCHQSLKTVSELIEMGYDRERIEALPEYNEQDYNEEKIKRFHRDDEWPTDSLEHEPSQREIDWYEIYMRVDWDGDGISELRQINAASQGFEIFDNEEADEAPLFSVTPIRMPHKFFGRSLAEVVMDIQLIKTEMLRQLLNNIYNLNNARTAVNDRVDLDAMLTQVVGGVVPIDGTQPVGDAFMEMNTTPIGDMIYPALEHFDRIRETRSGVFRMEQGLNADTLHDTMGGVHMLLSAAQKRILMIARTFAEGGVKDAFSHILTLITRHQDQPRNIKLRDSWESIDPSNWDPAMDVDVLVGLGHGTNEQRAMGSRMILDLQREILSALGPDNPLVNLGQVRNAFAQLIENYGNKNPDPFVGDPNEEEIQKWLQQKQQQSGKQDPTTAIAEMTLKTETMKEQTRDARERQKTAMENRLETEKMLLEDDRKRQELGVKKNTEAEKIRKDAAKALADAEHKSEVVKVAQEKLLLDEWKAEKDVELQEEGLEIERAKAGAEERDRAIDRADAKAEKKEDRNTGSAG